jgi:hypothetical protein
MIRSTNFAILFVLYASLASAFVAPRPGKAIGTVSGINVNTPPVFASRPQWTTSPYTSRQMASENEGESKSSLPFWLDPGTKGGAVFLSLVLFVVPIIGYNIVTGPMGYDEIEAGKWIGVGFTTVILFGWVSTYLFRVATKDMTYVSTAEVASSVDFALNR